MNMKKQSIITEIWCGNLLKNDYVEDREGDDGKKTLKLILGRQMDKTGSRIKASDGLSYYWCWTFRFCTSFSWKVEGNQPSFRLKEICKTTRIAGQQVALWLGTSGMWVRSIAAMLTYSVHAAYQTNGQLQGLTIFRLERQSNTDWILTTCFRILYQLPVLAEITLMTVMK